MVAAIGAQRGQEQQRNYSIPAASLYRWGQSAAVFSAIVMMFVLFFTLHSTFSFSYRQAMKKQKQEE